MTNESLEDIALTPCVRLNSSSGYVLGPADDDSMWNSFVEQLEDIYVNVEMVNSTATEFGISHLNEINNDGTFILWLKLQERTLRGENPAHNIGISQNCEKKNTTDRLAKN